MTGISRYEKWILVLTMTFAIITGGYFWGSSAMAQPYRVTATHADAQETSSEQKAALAESSSPDSLLEGEVINLNTADVYDLTRLPGIGEKKAEAIAAYRREHGPFTELDQLLDVSGIGTVTLDKLRPYVTLK